MRNRQRVCQKLIDQVVELCRDRILQRIRPPWFSQSSYPTKERSFLLSQLQEFRQQNNKESKNTPERENLFQKIDDLLDSIRPLEKEVDTKTERMHLDDIINKSADVVALGGRGSLEKYLRSLGFSQDCIDGYSIPQVDKLARYLYACKDLIRIVRQPTYSPLFQNITLKHMDAFPETLRPGTAKQCFVHAEMQQVFYYAQHPHESRPRAIGCSKSTCYLCDLFLKQQGLYRVSHSHKRLYSQWTLPDVDWMTQEQVENFSLILKFMTDHIRKTEEDLRWDSTPVQPARWSYGLESRAFTRVSSGSSVSDTNIRSAATTSRAPSSRAPSSKAPSSKAPSSKAPSSVPSEGSGMDSSATTLTEHPRRRRIRSDSGRRKGAVSRAASRAPDHARSRTRSRAPSNIRERGISRAPPPPNRQSTRDRAISRPPIPTRKMSKRSRDSSRPPSTRVSSSQATRSVPSTIRLRSVDLPFHHDVKENEPAIALEIDTISLIVEFPRESAGRLYISRKDPTTVGKGDISVDSMPPSQDIKLKNSGKSSLFAFQLRHSTITRLNVGFHWGSVT